MLLTSKHSYLIMKNIPSLYSNYIYLHDKYVALRICTRHRIDRT
jgi:hypothetical protein